MSKAKVSGVIVTFNPEVKVLEKALIAACHQLSDIYLIDNASQEISQIRIVAERFKNVHIKALDSNIGLASAQNIGIQAILMSDATHIILFDQDSIINDSFVESMIADENYLLSRGDNVGAIGPSFYDPVSMEKYPSTIYLGPFIKRVNIKENPVEATYLISSGCLFRTEVVKQVGLMQEQLFIDYIDVEWSLRARDKGYNLFISSSAKMSHTIGDSRSKIFGRTVSVHSPFRRYFLVRNSFYMLRLPYVPVGYKLRELIFNVARIALALIHSDDKIKVLKSAYFGIKDGVSGKFGPLMRKI